MARSGREETCLLSVAGHPVEEWITWVSLAGLHTDLMICSQPTTHHAWCRASDWAGPRTVSAPKEMTKVSVLGGRGKLSATGDQGDLRPGAL